MNTTPELIQEAQSGLNGMDDHLNSILEYCDLIALLLSAPDIENECPGLHRLVLVMRDHALALDKCQHRAGMAIGRLANP
ncbi:hypothetical protein Nwi_1488 [Nitrobacter winogradskyi Nb-255]|uniref:Uncharacterized protein n=1 Tax=Nitrobacter winogradskyi (strain ATCC 25391 / DSM 10237 / CIP 104748 / NCIMB 11846 / Nb-255) TaxID=323098 RepID=Q3SSJ2_NITWN|nr:hypothetical protein [Nitrobacter winogradskyi]ABA04749.1 hypothetical protein Nwi_1488 [Nitrobacter winogradskyi Nb-255]